MDSGSTWSMPQSKFQIKRLKFAHKADHQHRIQDARGEVDWLPARTAKLIPMSHAKGFESFAQYSEESEAHDDIKLFVDW